MNIQILSAEDIKNTFNNTLFDRIKGEPNYELLINIE
jgi:hypothetical protein